MDFSGGATNTRRLRETEGPALSRTGHTGIPPTEQMPSVLLTFAWRINPSTEKLLLARTQLTGLHATIFTRKQQANHQKPKGSQEQSVKAALGDSLEPPHSSLARSWTRVKAPCHRKLQQVSSSPALPTTAKMTHSGVMSLRHHYVLMGKESHHSTY